MGVLSGDDAWDPTPVESRPGDDAHDPWDHRVGMLPLLEAAVGGAEALAALDTAPLPDEPFDRTGIAADIQPKVDEVLALVDTCCDTLLDVEHRTACRRLLATIAVTGPEVFRRRGRSDTAAGAICWAVCQANGSFDQRRGGLTQKALGEHLGLTGGGGLGARATTMLAAGGFDTGGDIALGSPAYLVARRRRDIIARAERFAPDRTDAAGGATVHRLRITIDGTDPPVWRTVLVPSSIRLDRLHDVIQESFGWWDAHLHEFEIGGRRYGMESDDDWDVPALDERAGRLDRVARAQRTFVYTYDFGDGWTHRIDVDDVLPAEPGARYPRCVDGERAGPPEDVGGVSGYEELVRILADPNDPQHDEMRTWAGEDFDPQAFDVDEADARVMRTRA
jgi:hypothetical protein